MPKKSQSAKQPVVDQTSTPTPAPEPKWPVISAKSDLVCRTVEPDQIIVIDNFFSPKECKQYTEFIEKLPLEAPPPAKKGEASRTNHRISIQSLLFAASLYTTLSPLISSFPSFQKHLTPPATPHSLNSNIRLYRYTEGQYFGPHYDDSVKDPVTGDWSEWTLLLYVSGKDDGVEGGETVFHKQVSKKVTQDIVVPLTRGSALLHRHGRECMLHEGREVTKGTKLVLRSDLMFSQ